MPAKKEPSPGAPNKVIPTCQSPVYLLAQRMESLSASRFVKSMQRISLLLFGGLWLLLWASVLFPHAFRPSQWLQPAVLVIAAAATFLELWDELPLQNVVAASLVIGLAGVAMQNVARWAGADLGSSLAAGAYWVWPLVWLVAILSSRGSVRLALVSWRTSPVYGIWLLGLTAVGTAVFGMGFEAFVATAHNGISGQASHHTRLTIPLGWALTAIILQVLATPFLINKTPVPRAPGVGPLLIWGMANVFFLTAATCAGKGG